MVISYCVAGPWSWWASQNCSSSRLLLKELYLTTHIAVHGEDEVSICARAAQAWSLPCLRLHRPGCQQEQRLRGACASCCCHRSGAQCCQRAGGWRVKLQTGDCYTPIQKRKKRYKVLGQNLIKPRQHSCSIVKVLNSASEIKILQDVTDLWTMNITFYKEKLNPLSSLMTGATYWCKKQTAIVLVSDRQRNAASQKLSSPMILALYFIHVWTGVTQVWDLYV